MPILYCISLFFDPNANFAIKKCANVILATQPPFLCIICGEMGWSDEYFKFITLSLTLSQQPMHGILKHLLVLSLVASQISRPPHTSFYPTKRN